LVVQLDTKIGTGGGKVDKLYIVHNSESTTLAGSKPREMFGYKYGYYIAALCDDPRVDPLVTHLDVSTPAYDGNTQVKVAFAKINKHKDALSETQRDFVVKHYDIFTETISLGDVMLLYNMVCTDGKDIIAKIVPEITKMVGITHSCKSVATGTWSQINERSAFFIFRGETEGMDKEGHRLSGHLASIRLGTHNGTWYDENGNVIPGEGYLYFKPNA
jgi:hypothetical protein